MPDHEGERRKKFFYEDGGIYLGEFKPGTDVKQGYGTYMYPEGDMYQGHWKDNKTNGWGRLIHFDGEVYEG